MRPRQIVRPRLGAAAQHRREVRAGLRKWNDPTDTLWHAAWREVAASGWNMAGDPRMAEILETEAAHLIREAARRRSDR